MLENLDRFWGGGIINEPFPVKSAYMGIAIHNSFVYAWAKHGIFMTLYLLSLVIMCLIPLIKLIISKYVKIDFNYALFLFTIYTICLIQILIGWVHVDVTYLFMDTITMFQFSLIILMLKIDRRTFNNIFIKKNQN